MSNIPEEDPERAAVESDPLIGGKEVKNESFLKDCCDTLRLGAPIFLSMLSWVGVSIRVFGNEQPFQAGQT